MIPVESQRTFQPPDERTLRDERSMLLLERAIAGVTLAAVVLLWMVR